MGNIFIGYLRNNLRRILEYKLTCYHLSSPILRSITMRHYAWAWSDTVVKNQSHINIKYWIVTQKLPINQNLNPTRRKKTPSKRNNLFFKGHNRINEKQSKCPTCYERKKIIQKGKKNKWRIGKLYHRTLYERYRQLTHLAKSSQRSDELNQQVLTQIQPYRQASR